MTIKPSASANPPNAPSTSVSQSPKKTRKESKATETEGIGAEGMLENVTTQKNAQNSRIPAKKPRPHSSAYLRSPPVDKMVEAVQKKRSSKAIPSKPLPSLPHSNAATVKKEGSAIYRYKSDIIPLFKHMFNSGNLTCESFKEEVKQLPDLNKTQEQELMAIVNHAVQIAHQKLEKKEYEILNSHWFDNDTVLLPEKEAVNAYKEMSSSVERSIHQILEECLNEVKGKLKDAGMLQEAAQLFDRLAKETKTIVGRKRYETINNDPIWDPANIRTAPIALHSALKDTTYNFVSIFQAAGPGYSSQAPRDRDENTTCLANFWRSQATMGAGLEENPELVLDVTRSASPVEFGQKDEKKRKAATQKNLEQQIDAQVTHWIEKVAKSDATRLEANDRDHPLIFKEQTVNLLTPDYLRSWAREYPAFRKIASKFSHEISGQMADDERLLMKENMEAHRALDGKVVEYKIQDGNEERSLFIKYDLRYFNISNNRLDEKLPQLLKEDFSATNQASWDKLTDDVNEQNLLLKEEYEKVAKTCNATERKELDDILNEMEKCVNLRNWIVNHPENKSQFALWQNQADALAMKLYNIEKDKESSEQLKKAISLVQKRITLLDLYMDTKELFIQGAHKDLKNRNAFPARVILLSALTRDIQTHFGCRSGKDRTGLVDIELKLLAALPNLYGRILSYREQESLPDMNAQRDRVTEESDNTFGMERANLGAPVGLRTDGAVPVPDKNDPKAKRGAAARVQGYAKMVQRTETTEVQAGFREFWDKKDSKKVVINPPDSSTELR